MKLTKHPQLLPALKCRRESRWGRLSYEIAGQYRWMDLPWMSNTTVILMQMYSEDTT